ncbi:MULTISPECIES: trigger factor [Anaerotruncus]|jgi:trigger factor|uniref:trigger factor n=3 Tax=Oscillospiraceae TaxID=216572 RepID=UPI000E53ECD4|nr:MULTISPECIES: trigger factor [Anaerotruncus]RGX55732.1 trigger factor [Anaerotruncus sp. AF02-27]
MTVNSVKTNEDKRVELEIAVSAEDFGKALDEAFKKNSKKMQVPGFRRGHAPRKMIEKMYGEGIFFEDAINATYPAAYEAAVEEKGIEPVDRADIEVMEATKESGYTFKATVTVKPEVALDGYKGLEVEKKLYEVSDEEIGKEIDRMREQNARVIAVEGRAAANGDIATIDFEGFVDGAAFEGGKGTDYPLELGSNSFIPGFEDQVAGHNAGEEFEVNVSFPENYHAEELKGKPAVFKCTLKELKTKELPALDDEFAKDVSEFDTLDELKGDLRAKAQERKDEQSKAEVENKLMEAVVAKMQADIPQCMYDHRVDEMIRDFDYRLQSQGMNLQTYLQYTGMELASFRKTFAEQAEAQVKTRLALEKIVAIEGIEPTAEEYDAQIEKIAKNYNMKADEVKQYIPEKEIKLELALNKAIDLVRDAAVIKEVKDEPVKEAAEEKPKKASKPRAKKAKAAEAPAEAE